MEEKYTLEELRAGLELAIEDNDHVAANEIADRYVALEESMKVKEVKDDYSYLGGSYNTAIAGALGAGTANMAQNIYNAGRWAYNAVAPDEYEMPKDTFIDRGIDWVRTEANEMIDFSGNEGLFKDILVAGTKEIPGYLGAARLFKGANTVKDKIIQEGLRSGLGAGLTQDVQEDLLDFAGDAAIGGTIGMAVEGIAPAYRALTKSELDEKAISHFQKQYQKIQGYIDDPYHPLTERNAREIKLLGPGGEDVGIDFAFARNVNEVSNLVRENNARGGITGVDTIKSLLDNDERLIHYGIKPSRTENAYNWLASKVGRENLQLFGAAEYNVSAKRHKAMNAQVDDIQKTLKDLIDEDEAVYDIVTGEWQSITALLKQGLEGDKGAFSKANDLLDKLDEIVSPSQVVDGKVPIPITHKTAVKVLEQNRNLRGITKLSAKTKDANKYSLLTSLGALMGVGALSPSIIVPVALLGARGLGGKQVSRFTRRHLDNLGTALDKQYDVNFPIHSNVRPTAKYNDPYFDPETVAARQQVAEMNRAYQKRMAEIERQAAEQRVIQDRLDLEAKWTREFELNEQKKAFMEKLKQQRRNDPYGGSDLFGDY